MILAFTPRFTVSAIVLATMLLLNRNFAQAETTARFERGITGVRKFTYDGPPLRAKTQRDPTSALIVRLQPGSASSEYEVRFIGNVPGNYDLRDWCEHASGTPVSAMPSLPIEIVSTLPPDKRSDLFESEGFQPQIAGGYRIALILSVLAWLAIPFAVVLRRMMRPKPVASVASQPAAVPLIDQLRPLINAASAGTLSTSDKARLELLLLHYWRETEQLPQLDMASSIRQLRSHASAGPMIAAVEAWLHREPIDSTGNSLEHVLSLLRSLRETETRTVDRALNTEPNREAGAPGGMTEVRSGSTAE